MNGRGVGRQEGQVGKHVEDARKESGQTMDLHVDKDRNGSQVMWALLYACSRMEGDRLLSIWAGLLLQGENQR